MLRETFIHLPGVGETAERKLWKQGCYTWDDYLASPKSYSVGSAGRELVYQELQNSQRALLEGQHQYFRKRLRLKNSWRAFEDFRNSTVYLDIETDGGNDPDSVTMIGLYDGKEFNALIKGENLESFRDIISQYSTIVTFFGTGFDIPVLKRRFPDAIFDQIHIDLHPILRKLGYRGGLKKIEPQFGIQRSEDTIGLTGRDAVFLWRKYVRGSEEALDRLVAYNREDVVNLETLMLGAFEKLKRKVLIHRQEQLPGLELI